MCFLFGQDNHPGKDACQQAYEDANATQVSDGLFMGLHEVIGFVHDIIA
jgi:hypothetical protein